MESVISNVRDLEAAERRSLEAVVGHPLSDNERLIIQVVAIEPHRGKSTPPTRPEDQASPQLPDWCDVYEGLTEDEVADLEKVILQRADLTRD